MPDVIITPENKITYGYGPIRRFCRASKKTFEQIKNACLGLKYRSPSQRDRE